MDVNELRYYLNHLLSENSTNVVKDTVETLLKIHRNIKFNLNDPKYRKLKLQNAAFKNKVWNLNPAQNFMLKSGWVVVGDEIQFHKDENLWYIIDILLEYRNVTPRSSEWEENTKIENLHTSKQREEELRSKAALERQKELEEYKKEKLYREQLAQNVRKQIADDRKNRRQYMNAPANMPSQRPQPSYGQFHPSIQSSSCGSQQSYNFGQKNSKREDESESFDDDCYGDDDYFKKYGDDYGSNDDEDYAKRTTLKPNQYNIIRRLDS